MKTSNLRVILVVSLVSRVALVILNLEITTLPQGGADAVVAEQLAWQYAVHGREDLSFYLRSQSDFILLPASFIYSVTGRSQYVLSFVMVALGVGGVYLAHKAALELWGDRRAALRVAWFVALFPQLLLHSALFLREIPFAFCLTGAALCVIRYVNRQDFGQALWFACWVAVGALFHSGAIFAIPAFALGTLLARPQRRSRRARFHLANLLATVFLVGVVFMANETGFGLGKFGGSLDGARATFEHQEWRDPTGGAAYPDWLRVRGGLSDAWKIPVRVVAVVFSPLVPFMVRSANHWLGIVDALLYMFLFLSLWRQRRAIKANPASVVLVVVMLTLFLVFALGVSNFGTAIRHRAKMAPILLVVAGGLTVLRRPESKKALALKRRRRLRVIDSERNWRDAPIA